MIEQTDDPKSDLWRWNLLLTAQEGSARDLKRLVKRYGVFRWSGFRNVLLGQVADAQEFLRELAVHLEEKPFAGSWLGRALPILTTFAVHPEGLALEVQSHLADLVGELQNKSFHVRVERRGHKGQLHSHDLEIQLGTYLWEELERRGAHPIVSFRDPDTVIAIEIVGATAGIALISRALRTAFPFVKVD